MLNIIWIMWGLKLSGLSRIEPLYLWIATIILTLIWILKTLFLKAYRTETLKKDLSTFFDDSSEPESIASILGIIIRKLYLK